MIKFNKYNSPVLNKYANERLVLGGDSNCAINEIDKHGGRLIEHKKRLFEMILLTRGDVKILMSKDSRGTIHR